jgi:hypothetical protein
LHLAATLKKLITILLLIVLAGQSSGYFHTNGTEISFMQGTDEKDEKGGKEKQDKEFATCEYSHNKVDSLQNIFATYSSDLGASSIFDLPTPPPDSTC